MKTTALSLELRSARIVAADIEAATQIPARSVRYYLAGKRAGRGERPRQIVEAARSLGAEIPPDPWVLVDDPDAARVEARNTTKARTEPTPEEDEMAIPSRTDLFAPDLSHFKLRDDPFDIHIPPSKTWTCDRLTVVDEAVMRAVRRRRIVVVVGDVGAGKTTTMRRLEWRFREESAGHVRLMTPGNLDRGSIREAALTAAMLRDLGVDPAGMSAETRGDALRKALADARAMGELPVLFIDEGHEMRDHGLIAIKRIWDSFTFEQSLAVIIVGQLSLETRLRAGKDLKELTGRSRIVRIPPLGLREIADYLSYRLGLVGGALESVFDKDSLGALQRVGAVYPLWIDALASQAMQLARRTQSPLVTAAIVRQAAIAGVLR